MWVELKRLLGRCRVLAERIFSPAKDGRVGEIVTCFLRVLGEMTEDAFESLEHLGSSPKPKTATVSEEILCKGSDDIGSCAIPRVPWDRPVPAGLRGLGECFFRLGRGTPVLKLS